MPSPPTSATIHVCPLAEVERLAIASKPRRMVSVIAPDMMPPTPPGIDPAHHLRLGFHDIAQPSHGMQHPNEAHVEQIVGFVRDWNHDGPLLIHCWAGISRSTAAAYITLCALNDAGREHDLALALRTASPIATPNRLMITHADRLLGRQGRMLTALEAIGRGATTDWGRPFSLASRPV